MHAFGTTSKSKSLQTVALHSFAVAPLLASMAAIFALGPFYFSALWRHRQHKPSKA
jgi:hypothetical protein